MCYSAQVWQDYRRFAKTFGAAIDIREYVRLYARRRAGEKIKINKAMDAALAEWPGDEGDQLRTMIAEYDADQKQTLEAKLFVMKRRLADAERVLKSKTTKKALNDQRIATNELAKTEFALDELRRTGLKPRDARIFPGGYAPVMIVEDGRRVIKPMRFRCRLPGWTSAIERKKDGSYCARRDKLATSWRSLFGRKHGVVVVEAFYEHVDRAGQNTILEFRPDPPAPMLVACIWSDWRGDADHLLSFGVVTDDPPPEVAAAGHDRCLVPLKLEHVDTWLMPELSDLATQFAVLDDRYRPFYEHREAA